jgi:TonB family protein
VLRSAIVLAVATALLPLPATAASPVPQPTSCKVPDAPAFVVRVAHPDLPPLEDRRHLSGYVRVLVWLDARGRVVDTRIQSSPSIALNEAAREAAESSTYQPARHDCAPVPGTYLLSLRFDSR